MEALPHTVSDLICKIVCENTKAVGIYCFAEKKRSCTFITPFKKPAQKEEHRHLYLLIVVEEFEEHLGNDLNDKIKSHSKGLLTATVLLHSVRNIVKLYGDQQFFLNTILKNSHALFVDTANHPVVAVTPQIRHLKSTALYATNRKTIIEVIWDRVYSDDDNSSYEVKMCSLHQIVEQTCLSLIRVFLGYTPNHFSLGYLFDLCDYFSTITSDFFPRNSKEDKMLFKLLGKNSNTLRFARINSVDYLYYHLMENRCRIFKKEAGVLIQKELERLQVVYPEGNGGS